MAECLALWDVHDDTRPLENLRTWDVHDRNLIFHFYHAWSNSVRLPAL